MQQKMLSDQPLQQERRAKRKRNKNDGFCVLGLCFYAVVFWRPCALACRNTFAFAFLAFFLGHA
ncbi:hypothetical protein, partial [Ferruginibacter sp.]|uniref:hypothetical protein n=1 Tax=Ferruginibacter sp. TaxID=1940288 RepID=UPI00265A2F6A